MSMGAEERGASSRPGGDRRNRASGTTEVDGVTEMRALVAMLNHRGIRLELAAELDNEAEYDMGGVLVLHAGITPSRLRRLRLHVAESLLGGTWPPHRS